MSAEITLYRELLSDIKVRVRRAQQKAALSANAEMILMYWDIGHMIDSRQKRDGWGAGVIPRLALDLKNELPDEKGFSERNLKYMIRFFREYPVLQQPPAKLVQQPAALLESIVDKAPVKVQQLAAPLDSGSMQAIPSEFT